MTDRNRSSDIQLIASEVEPQWVQEFVLEARLSDVPGDRIGDALAEVNAHCRDSGEPARSTFGDPGAYARTIAETFPVPRPSRSRHLGPLVVQIAGMVTVIKAVGELARGGEVTVTWGFLAMLVVIVAWCGLLTLIANRVLELIVRRPLLAAGGIGAACAAAVVPSVLLLRIDAQVVVITAPVALAIGLILLAVGIARELMVTRDAREIDPVVTPGQQAPARRMHLLMPATVIAWTLIGSAVVTVAGVTSGA